MARIRADYVFGTTTAALAAGDTTLASAELARLPAVTGSDIAAVTLHDSATGAYEIVHVTAHTASATTATILRAREGSTAQAWASGTTWTHSLTVADMADLGGGASGTLIASSAYNPAAATVPVLTATEADIDATNLAVTFTAPASGAVLVTASIVAIVSPPTTSGSATLNLSFRSGASSVTGSRGRVFIISAGDKDIQARVIHKAKATGLTPGASYTYKLAGWNSGTGTCYVAYGDPNGTSPLGPAIFEVFAA